MIDFNDAPEQGTGGPIPADSIVLLQLNIREPKNSGADPALHYTEKGASLDLEFEVMAGSFKGKKLWQYMMVEGSEKAAAISMRTLRAIVESARGISPKDGTPAAMTARKLSAWFDLNGLTFVAKVGIEAPQVGDKYVNNNLKRILTVDDDAYAAVKAGGEVITANPIPVIPEAGGAPSTAKWGAPAATPAPAAAAPPGARPVPAWAQKKAG